MSLDSPLEDVGVQQVGIHEDEVGVLAVQGEVFLSDGAKVIKNCNLVFPRAACPPVAADEARALGD